MPSRKPNLLFILADDHAGYVLGADGNQRARTPNLDHLASEGVRLLLATPSPLLQGFPQGIERGLRLILLEKLRLQLDG